ncbi:MAG: DNRLRE domain-containing protein, partial [Phycisphaerales bacterium]|nr:DNRLRE domain-containing protein [Phycisphaerales bacterium]
MKTTMLTMVAIASIATADTITVGTTKDNTLYDDSFGLLNSNGAGTWMFCGSSGSGLRRGLMQFDLSAIPAGSTIDAVTLTLRMDRTIAGPAACSVHPVLQDWGEGTSDASGQEGGGASATPGDVTWTHTFFPGNFWTTPGGDYTAAASATTTVGGNGSYDWTSPAMAADVQGWLDAPATNFGWVLIGDEVTLPSAKRFATRENPVASARPALRIDFTPPADCAPDLNGDTILD